MQENAGDARIPRCKLQCWCCPSSSDLTWKEGFRGKPHQFSLGESVLLWGNPLHSLWPLPCVGYWHIPTERLTQTYVLTSVANFMLPPSHPENSLGQTHLSTGTCLAGILWLRGLIPFAI